jgi:hypothetical protein
MSSFEVWKQKVDQAMQKLCGLSCDDLPDFDYYSAYQNGWTPMSAARSARSAANEY